MRRNELGGLVGCIGLVVLTGWLCFVVSSGSRSVTCERCVNGMLSAIFLSEAISVMGTGDLLLVRNQHTATSKCLCVLAGSWFSHVALTIVGTDGVRKVIEAMPPGVPKVTEFQAWWETQHNNAEQCPVIVWRKLIYRKPEVCTLGIEQAIEVPQQRYPGAIGMLVPGLSVGSLNCVQLVLWLYRTMGLLDSRAKHKVTWTPSDLSSTMGDRISMVLNHKATLVRDQRLLTDSHTSDADKKSKEEDAQHLPVSLVAGHDVGAAEQDNKCHKREEAWVLCANEEPEHDPHTNDLDDGVPTPTGLCSVTPHHCTGVEEGDGDGEREEVSGTYSTV